MKKKYKVLFAILTLIFVVLVIFLLLKKNKTYVNSFESSSKNYLISYESGYEKNNYCDRYYDGLGTKVYKMNEVDEGYPMYLINGCAVGLPWYLSNTDDDQAACIAQKEYAQKNIQSYSIVEYYNSSCKNITGELVVNYDGITCSEAKTLIEKQYIDYLALYNNWFKTNCSSTTINIDKSKTYYSNSYCESLKFNNEFTGILKYNNANNTCGYDLFYINGATVSLDYYIEKGGNKAEYCSYMKGRLQSNYIANLYYVSEYNKYCTPTTNTSEFKNGVTKITEISDSCANYINIYKGVLAPTIALKKGEYTAGNACDHTVYYYNGQPYKFEDIFEKDDVTPEEKANLCSVRYDDINGTNSNYDTFNYYCSSVIGKSLNYEETIDVVFQANDGNGLECKNLSTDKYTASTTANNECTYRFKESLKGQTITLNYNELPKTSGLVQLTTEATFNGWKRGNSFDCSSKTGSLSISLPDDGSSVTYSPCYSLAEKKTLGYTLYQNCDGNYITSISGSDINGNTDVENMPVLKSSVSATKNFATTSTTSTTVDNTFKLNNFCTISCTETVNYNYPTIFETVKSGTYFELLSYPEVKSYLTCTENFSYDNWSSAYNSQVEKEKMAYVKKENSSAINGLSFSKTNNVCSTECTRTCVGGGCCESKKYYTYSATTNIYSYNSGTVSSSPQTFSYCERYGSASNTISSAKATYGVNSGNANYYSGLYDASKGQRISLESANTYCVNAMTKETITTDNFYKPEPNLYFYYESDVDNNEDNLIGDTTSYHKDTLKASSSYTNDTDIHDWDVDTFYSEKFPISFSYGGQNFSFESIKTNNSFLRTVTRNYVYNKSDSHDKYYTKNQTGEITTSSSNAIELGYVYPVSLTLSGSRKIYFSLDYDTNLSYGAKEVLGSEGSAVSDKNVYQCTYDISNDVIIEDTTTIDEDFKKNFYIRSISTQDVDPNDRFNNGLLGANWSNDKGQTLIAEIEKRAENNNTYNPDYLEYSFTLNATTIEAIKSYNAASDKGYDDFNLDCNNFGGECVSKFLDALGNSKLDGKSLTGVNAYIKREKDATWKYYIGDKWYTLKRITDYANISSDCSSYKNDEKEYYECLYRNVNEGVLP